jgi:glycogen operon protein
MLLSGDELGHTQQGNNNAYCQDNELTWIDWENVDRELRDFVRRLILFRREHPMFQRRKWFQGRPIHGSDVHDLSWFKPDGEEMEEEHWGESFAKSLGVFLNGEGIASRDMHGERIVDDSFFLVFNAHHESVRFVLPPQEWASRWVAEMDTAAGGWLEPADAPSYGARDEVEVEGRALVVLRALPADA